MVTRFQLEETYNLLEKDILLDLSAATMPAMSLNDLLAYYSIDQQPKILDSILNTKLGYSEQYGSLHVRKLISEKLYASNLELQASSLLLTSGASEAIFLVMSTMFAAGDSIIVQQPIYQSLYQVAADRGVKVIDWDLSTQPTQSWCLEELQTLIKKHPETKALVINNPNNPTGLGFKREELKQITELLDGRYLISDEVFLFISQNQLPSALEVYENSIVISDLSKSFNMPGLRLGRIASSSVNGERSTVNGNIPINHQLPTINLLEQYSSLKNYLSLRTNTLSETIAPWVLEKHSEISSKNRSLIQSNIEHLYSLYPDKLVFDLSQIPQESIEGLCIFPRMRDESVIDRLWDQQGIFVAKGVNFGENWGKYLRIGLKDKF